LGKSTAVELVEIQWPGGTKQSFRNVPAGKFYLVAEGSDPLSLQKIDGR
jgi:ASPIC and UnbV